MNKTLLLAGVACLLATSANAMMPQPYVSAKVRASVMDNELKWNDSDGDKGSQSIDKSVIGGSFALGLRVPLARAAWRSEVEYNINSNAEKKLTDEDGDRYELKLKSQAVMFNSYIDIYTNTPFNPYIGGGIGFSSLKLSDRSLTYPEVPSESIKDETNFAWQIGVGVACNLSNNVAVDLGYRYMDYGSFKKKEHDEDGYSTDKVEAKAHEIALGLRYSF